jgi:hypothetical protein
MCWSAQQPLNREGSTLWRRTRTRQAGGIRVGLHCHRVFCLRVLVFFGASRIETKEKIFAFQGISRGSARRLLNIF